MPSTYSWENNNVVNFALLNLSTNSSIKKGKLRSILATLDDFIAETVFKYWRRKASFCYKTDTNYLFSEIPIFLVDSFSKNVVDRKLVAYHGINGLSNNVITGMQLNFFLTMSLNPGPLVTPYIVISLEALLSQENNNLNFQEIKGISF